MMITTIAALAAMLCAGGPQDPRKEQLRVALKDDAVKGNWHYDDLNAGIAEAKKSAKPMLIVFR